jgi:hypothetical protein
MHSSERLQSEARVPPVAGRTQCEACRASEPQGHLPQPKDEATHRIHSLFRLRKHPSERLRSRASWTPGQLPQPKDEATHRIHSLFRLRKLRLLLERGPSPGWALLALLALAGCHDFRAVEADGRCGNRVWEPERGEDCDGHPNLGGVCGDPNDTRACRLVCDEVTPCPPGFGCGQDGICRAPAGTFVSHTVLPLPGGRIEAGDVDGDGRNDLISFGNTEVSVAYGDAAAEFASRVYLPTPPLDGAPVVGHLDDDATLDMVLPLSSGPQLVLGQASRTPRPVAVALPLPDTGDAPQVIPTRAEPPYEQHQLLVVGNGRFSVGGRTLEASEVEAALAGVPTALGEHIPVARLGDQPGPDTIALAPLGHDRVYLVQLACSPAPAPCRLALRDTLVLPEATTVLGSAFFGDFDDSGTLDLILGGLRGTEPVLAVAFDEAGGRLAPPTVQPGMGMVVADPNHPFPLVRTARLRAVGALDTTPGIDFVTLDGGFVQGLAGGPRLQRAIVTVRPWRESVAADFNGDGHLDVAGIRPGSIDILLQTGEGTHNLLQAPTPDALGLRVADLDGDLAPDLLVMETSGTLAAIFAGRQQVPSERIEMGQFVRPTGLVHALLANLDERTADGISDVALIGTNDDGDPALYTLRGTNARRLIGPITALGVPNAYQVGRFGPAGPSVAMKEDIPPANPGPREPFQPGFRLASADDALAGRLIAPPLLTAGAGCDDDMNRDFDFGTAVDLDADGIDEWLLIQRYFAADPTPYGEARAWYPRVLRFSEGGYTCEVLPPLTSLFPPGAVPELADLDGDGARDLVVPLTRRRGDMTPGRPGVAIWWGDGAGGFEAPVQVGPERDPDGLPTAQETSPQIAILDLDEAPGPDLLVADERGLVRVVVGADRRLEEVPLASRATRVAQAVRTLDANGDGLADLALGTANEVFIHLQDECDARRAAQGQCVRPEAP